MNRIDIRFIPEAEMRMPGLGDWWWDEGVLHVRAVDSGTLHEAFLVALHEMAEAWLCLDKRIPQAEVDAFDSAFEAERHPDDAEPGDDPRAPYRVQHRQAMMVEMLMALFLGLDAYGTVR